MKTFKLFLIIVTLIFAFIGLLFSGVFVAMEFGLLNVRGSIEARNNSIIDINSGPDLPRNDKTSTTTNNADNAESSCEGGSVTCQWSNTSEWEVVAGGLTKDQEIIRRVAEETGVSPRLIAAVVVPEQIRFFTDNREVFKRYFEPLKILGSLSKFSLGVSGIKQDTAVIIEQHANNPESPFYPGVEIANLLSYPEGVDTSTELFNRLTDEKNHYYSYLYTAVFIKEILLQWERAGYDISNEADVVATIFNIGFGASKPNPSPRVAGTTITVGGIEYTFGKLAGLFYDSELLPTLKK